MTRGRRRADEPEVALSPCGVAVLADALAPHPDPPAASSGFSSLSGPPFPLPPLLGSRPLLPSPRGGDRRACNLVPFARLEQHLPPSPGTRGSHPKPYKKPETNPSPHATRTRRRGTACSHRQLGTLRVQTPKCHQKLSFSSSHLNKQTKIRELFL